MFTENLHFVAHSAIHVGNVSHKEVHTDVAHRRHSFAVNPYFSVSTTQTAIKTIGITDRDSGDARGAREHSVPTVPDSGACLPLANLNNHGM